MASYVFVWKNRHTEAKCSFLDIPDIDNANEVTVCFMRQQCYRVTARGNVDLLQVLTDSSSIPS